MARLRRKLICRASRACPIQKRTETFLLPSRIRIDHTARSTFLTYDDQIETAISDQDIDRLIKFAYGDTCRCTTVKGEPMCVCKMLATALRSKVVPRSLFENRIERVASI
jgi:hypothetical protein